MSNLSEAFCGHPWPCNSLPFSLLYYFIFLCSHSYHLASVYFFFSLEHMHESKGLPCFMCLGLEVCLVHRRTLTKYLLESLSWVLISCDLLLFWELSSSPIRLWIRHSKDRALGQVLSKAIGEAVVVWVSESRSWNLLLEFIKITLASRFLLSLLHQHFLTAFGGWRKVTSWKKFLIPIPISLILYFPAVCFIVDLTFPC